MSDVLFGSLVLGSLVGCALIGLGYARWLLTGERPLSWRRHRR